MGGERKIICRLCLKAAGMNFEVIEDVSREMFDVLLLNVNLSINDEPVMCEDCTENIQRYFFFKSSCMSAEDWIFPFTFNETDASVDLRKAYFNLNKDVIPEDYNICRFCIQHNLKGIRDPMICMKCMETLDCYFSFMTKCRNIEKKIVTYIKTEGTSSKGLVQLSDVVQFPISNLLQSDTKPSHVNVFKMEKSFLENGENEEVEVKEGTLIKAEQGELIIKDEEAEMNIEKSNSDSFHVEDHSSQAATKSGMMYKCRLCKFQAKYRIGLNKHMRVHEEDFEKNKVDVHSSQQNIYVPNFKYNLDGRMLNGETCTFQAQYMNSLQSNKDGKFRIYGCKMCSHQAIDKSNLAKHMLIHKKPSEVTMFKCALCTYQTNRKSSLQEHVLLHKKPSEITLHKCSVCKHQTRRKSSLKLHMLIHMKPSEVTMYKCEVCSYQTNLKCNLNRHLVKHKNRSETAVYKCTEFLF